MTDLKAVVSLPFVSGLPEDVAVNTFHFDVPAGNPGTGPLDALAGAITNIYNADNNGPATAMSRVISRVISRAANACSIDFYEGPPGGPYGSPIAIYPWTLGAALPDPVNMPSEVAITCSFAADYGSVAEIVPGGAPGPAGDTKPRARRRGRIYFGPLTVAAAIQTAATDPPRPHPAHRTALANGLDQLHAIAATVALTPWSVASRADGVLRPVVRAWIDDDFDTQRRRGVSPTARTAITF